MELVLVYILGKQAVRFYPGGLFFLNWFGDSPYAICRGGLLAAAQCGLPLANLREWICRRQITVGDRKGSPLQWHSRNHEIVLVYILRKTSRPDLYGRPV